MPLWRGCARCSVAAGPAESASWAVFPAAVHRLLRGSVVGAGDCVAGRGFAEPAGFPGSGQHTEAPPNHSTLSRTRRLIDVETHVAVFTWVLERLAGAGLVHGRRRCGSPSERGEGNEAFELTARRPERRRLARALRRRSRPRATVHDASPATLRDRRR